MHDPMTQVGQFPPFALAQRIPWKIRRRFMPTLAEVWHHDPSDYDSDTCGQAYRSITHWRHWSLRFPPLNRLRRALFDRCAWCGGWMVGKSVRGGVVKHYEGPPERSAWWRSTPSLYHSKCSIIASEYARRRYEQTYTNGQRDPDPSIVAAIWKRALR